MSLYDKIFPPKEYTLANGKTVSKPASRMPLVCLIVVLMCAVSVRVTGFDLSVLIKRGEQFFVILEEMFTPPNWSYHRQVWAPLFDTIKMSLLGSVIGTAAAVPFAVLASTNIIKSRIVVSATRLMSAWCARCHAGVRAGGHLCVRPGHAGRYHRHRHLHLCIHGQDPLRGDRDGGYGRL